MRQILPDMANVMRPFAILAASLAGMLAADVRPASALAFNITAFVDPANGTDAVGCGVRGSECRTLNGGLQAAGPGGTVVILSGGNFGPIHLTQPVRIIGPADRSAFITWSAVPPGCVGAAPGTCGRGTASYAVEIAGGANDTYRLENVVIDNGDGTSGAMKIGNAFNVSLTGVVLRGGAGAIPQILLAAPTAAAPFQLFMAQCDVGFSASGGGILVQGQGSSVPAVQLIGTVVHNAKFGFKLDSTQTDHNQHAEIHDSAFTSFNGSGISVVGTDPGGGIALLNVSRSSVMNAGTIGIQSNGTRAIVSLYASNISGNFIGVNKQAGGAVFSAGDNWVGNNSIPCEHEGAVATCTSVLNLTGTN